MDIHKRIKKTSNITLAIVVLLSVIFVIALIFWKNVFLVNYWYAICYAIPMPFLLYNIYTAFKYRIMYMESNGFTEGTAAVIWGSILTVITLVLVIIICKVVLYNMHLF